MVFDGVHNTRRSMIDVHVAAKGCVAPVCHGERRAHIGVGTTHQSVLLSGSHVGELVVAGGCATVDCLVPVDFVDDAGSVVVVRLAKSCIASVGGLFTIPGSVAGVRGAQATASFAVGSECG